MTRFSHVPFAVAARASRVRALQEEFESWKALHDEATHVRDVEDLVSEVLKLPDEMEVLDRRVWSFLEGDHLPASDAAGNFLRPFYDRPPSLIRATRPHAPSPRPPATSP